MPPPLTALTKFQRLEAQGIWLAKPGAPPQEVIVSIGEATLTLMDPRSERPLSHWSLPSVSRLNPGKLPAIYTPNTTTADETVEIDDSLMIEGIARVQKAIAHHRSAPGRLRTVLTSMIALIVIVSVAIWMPDAIIRHAAHIAPPAQTRHIGMAVLADMERRTGSMCQRNSGRQVLDWMTPQVIGNDALAQVLPGSLNGALRLPGNLYVVSDRLLTASPGPETAAGHLIAAQLSTDDEQATLDALRYAGSISAIRLMTLGVLPEGAMYGYGEVILSQSTPRPDNAALIKAFAERGLTTEPYALSMDPTGASVLSLIEGNPVNNGTPARALLTAEQWRALQQICAG